MTAHLTRAATAALCLMVTAACGTTVSVGVRDDAATTRTDGLSGPAGFGPGAAVQPGSTTGPSGATHNSDGTDASTSTTAPGSSSKTGASGTVGDAAGGAADIVGPGVTPTTITIGLVYTTNSEAADKAIGANGITNGNGEAEVRLLVDDINKHGGVAGRRLVLLPYGEDGTSTQPYAVTAQQMCSFMTQDHKVLAVISAGYGDPKSCLNKAGTALFDGNLLGLSDSDGRSGIDFATAAMNIDRSVLASVRAWTSADWFAPWNTSTGRALPGGHFKLGVLTIDDPVLNHTVDKVLIPALVRAGHPAPDPQDIVRLHEPASAGDDGNVLAEIQSSVLKFRQDGVDHVVIMDSNGSATLFFANDAYSQRYFPRLGGGSGNAFQTLLETGNVQPQSIAGAVAAGWAPVLDLPYGGGHSYESPAASHCRELMRAGGQTFSNANAEAYALGYCDVLSIIARGLDTATQLTALGLAQAVEKLARSMPSALTVGLRLAAGHHDGAGAFYANVYDDSCGCFRYRGARQLV